MFADLIKLFRTNGFVGAWKFSEQFKLIYSFGWERRVETMRVYHLQIIAENYFNLSKNANLFGSGPFPAVLHRVPQTALYLLGELLKRKEGAFPQM